MIVNLDADGYTKIQNHRKAFLKTCKKQQPTENQKNRAKYNKLKWGAEFYIWLAREGGSHPVPVNYATG